MTDMVTFRTSDLTRWGTGQGSRLGKSTIDINFWVLLSRLVALEDHAGVTGRGIEDIFIASGSDDQMYVALTDSTILGPFTLPKTTWNFTNPPTGAWLPSVSYHVDDVFSYGNVLYQVIRNHTSAATFDPGANDGAGHNYYKVMLSTSPTPVKAISASTYTAIISDANAYLRFTNTGTSGAAFNIPPHSAVPFPLFTEFTLRDETGKPANGLVVEPLSPVMLNQVNGYLNMSLTSGATIGLKQVAIDSWDIMGLLAKHS